MSAGPCADRDIARHFGDPRALELTPVPRRQLSSAATTRPSRKRFSAACQGSSLRRLPAPAVQSSH